MRLPKLNYTSEKIFQINLMYKKRDILLDFIMLYNIQYKFSRTDI